MPFNMSDVKQLVLYGANSVVDTGLGRLNERDGRRGDLLFKKLMTEIWL